MLLDDNCIRPDKILDSHPLWLPVCLSNQNVPSRKHSRRLVVQVAISSFPPPDNRVSGITGLLADGNSAQASPVPGAIAYIFDERRPVERDAHYHHTLFPSLPSQANA